ncbi:oligosaccharide flippase family protein [Vibrio sp. 10N.222.55.E8]
MNFQRLISDSVYSLISTLVLKAVVFISSIIIARIFGPEEFGRYGIVISTVNMVMIFASLGLGMTLTKYVAENKNNPCLLSNYVMGSISIGLVLSTIISVCLYAFSTELAVYFFHDETLSHLMRFSAFMVFSNCFIGLSVGALQGFREFKSLFYSNVFTAVLLMALLFLTLPNGTVNDVLHAMLISSIFDNITKFSILVCCLRKYNYKFIIPTLAVYKRVTSFAVPTLLNGICFLPFLWYSKTLLVIGDNGLYQAGLFDAAYQWLTLIMLITGAISTAIFPVLSKNNSDFIKVYKFGILTSITIPLLLVIVIYPLRIYIANLYGPGYEELIDLIPVSIIITVFYSAWSVMSKVSSAKGKPWQVFFGNIIWGGVIYIFGSDFVSKGGALELLKLMLIAWVVVCVYFSLQNFIVLKRSKFETNNSF